jgi:putative transposase
MEERKSIARTYMGEGLKVDIALSMAEISKSTFYTNRSYKSRGISKTKTTEKLDETIDDSEVVERIKAILSEPYINYGYRKITIRLKRERFKIGRKKVYRLMRENNLLNVRKKSKAPFDKHIIKSKPRPVRAFEILELDIKYVYIHGLGKTAYLMTILDTFTREVYGWRLELNMRTTEIKLLIEKFIDDHLIKNKIKTKEMSISFRTDNGSQFVSKLYMDIMKTFEFIATYIPPATPQLNGHIESYHSVVEKDVCQKHTFKTLEHARKEMKLFVDTYNNKRELTVLLDMPPKLFKYAWDKGYVVQKVIKNKLIFFFKEEDKEKQLDLYDQIVSEYNMVS